MGKVQRLFSKFFGTSDKERIRDNILNEDIDFSNVVSSSLLAKGLYDELKKICHPDRFHSEQDINKANELFQLVSQNKGDYNKLVLLKEQIFNELPVNNNH